MHTVVIRSDIVEKHPFVATSLFNAFNDAKDLAFRRRRFLDMLRYMLPRLASEINEIDQVLAATRGLMGLRKQEDTRCDGGMSI
jgi:4,5-dihydroxyphthalate decarboxylase